MKKNVLFSVLFGMVPLLGMAQDDLYFTPGKKDVKEKMAKENVVDEPTFYSGSNRDIDEYNRRGKLGSYYQKIGVDSLGNDIIEFHAGNGEYPNEAFVDTVYPGSERYYDDADDFAYSRRMGRFDGFYGWYDPYFYGPWHYRWGWYDPWYAGYWGWGGYYGWYDPWYFGYGWGYPYRYWGWGGPAYYGYRGGVSGTRNHSSANASLPNGRFGGARYGTFGNNRQLGNRTSAIGNRTTSRNGNFGGARTYGGHQSTNTSTRSNTPSRSSSSSGSFGSRSSFGGGSHSGSSFGGGRSGGSGGGGGHFGGRR